MKLIERLALEHTAKATHREGDPWFAAAIRATYEAGFRKAREMATEMADNSAPQMGDPVTDDQIRQLGEEEVPGPELDALVAERVLGCKVWKQMDALAAAVDQQEYEGLRRLDPYECRCADNAHRECVDDLLIGIKRYSTDIAAAWEVVERLKGNVSVQRAGQRWWASFGEHKEEADTAPHAICLAALKACGVEVT